MVSDGRDAPTAMLYDREINFKIETIWEGGFDVALGDPMNLKAKGNVKTFEEAVTWLMEQASIHFPNMPDENALDENMLPD
jgi:hypothetical protein